MWHRAGLKGIARDNDMSRLLARGDEAAQQAIDLFCYRARKYVGAYLAALGGAQAIVFTGGIGENAPMIRSRILSGLESLGIERRAALWSAGGLAGMGPGRLAVAEGTEPPPLAPLTSSQTARIGHEEQRAQHAIPRAPCDC